MAGTEGGNRYLSFLLNLINCYCASLKLWFLLFPVVGVYCPSTVWLRSPCQARFQLIGSYLFKLLLLLQLLLLILYYIALCSVSQPTLLDSEAVEYMFGILRGPTWITESTQTFGFVWIESRRGSTYKVLAITANTMVERNDKFYYLQKYIFYLRWKNRIKEQYPDIHGLFLSEIFQNTGLFDCIQHFKSHIRLRLKLMIENTYRRLLCVKKTG